jgi:hypothetical protein
MGIHHRQPSRLEVKKVPTVKPGPLADLKSSSPPRSISSVTRQSPH